MIVSAIRMAMRNVFRQGARSIMPLSVVAIASFVIILVGGFYQYMFDSLEIQSVQTEGHVWITRENGAGEDVSSPIPLVDEATFKVISALPGVVAIAPRATVSGVIGHGDASSIFSGTMIDPEAEAKFRSYGRKTPNAAVMTARIGRLLGTSLAVGPGDWVSGLAEDRGFSVQIGELVETEAEEKDRFFIEIPFSSMPDVDFGMIDSVHIQASPKSNIDDLAKSVRTVLREAGFGTSAVHTAHDSTGYVRSVRTIYQNNLFFIMVVLAITIFFGITTSFTMSISERSQELGTMRSFGAPDSHINFLFATESLFMAFYGFIGGLSLALVTGSVINCSGGIVLPAPPTTTAAMRLSWVFGPGYAAISFVLVVSVSFLSSIFTTIRLSRLQIIDQLNLNV
jgi:putative ABC transport system permease protein